jgi:hypothetical protein
MTQHAAPSGYGLRVFISLLVIIGLCTVFLSYTSHPGIKNSPSDSCACSNETIVFGPNVPGDGNQLSFQEAVDCFAWAEFVALNWPAGPSVNQRGFGDPRDLLPVQWETYMPKEVLYPKDGQAPPPWGSTVVPQTYTGQIRALGLPATTKVLHFISKFEDADLKPFIQRTTMKNARSNAGSNASSGQAFPFDDPSWLGAQNGTNVWYEVLLNKDIYDYVVKTHFYDARVQWDSAKKGSPIFFPFGVFNGAVGAIELKAAWMEVTDSANPKWNRFKLSSAQVIDATTGQLRSVTVALVGLHILHKTQSQKSWVWSTFEQVDNVPGSPGGTTTDYSFYSAQCVPKTFTVPTGCTASTSTNPVTVGCKPPNTPPPYELCKGGPGPVPIQATRLLGLSQTSKDVNKRMQEQIKNRNRKSVWQYYELVNALWSNIPQQPQTDTMSTPFPMNIYNLSPSPITSPVSNTTMETYIQDSTCTGCHVYAGNARIPGTGASKFFADFSFAIGSASPSKGAMASGRSGASGSGRSKGGTALVGSGSASEAFNQMKQRSARKNSDQP